MVTPKPKLLKRARPLFLALLMMSSVCILALTGAGVVSDRAGAGYFLTFTGVVLVLAVVLLAAIEVVQRLWSKHHNPASLAVMSLSIAVIAAVSLSIGMLAAYGGLGVVMLSMTAAALSTLFSVVRAAAKEKTVSLSQYSSSWDMLSITGVAALLILAEVAAPGEIFAWLPVVVTAITAQTVTARRTVESARCGLTEFGTSTISMMVHFAYTLTLIMAPMLVVVGQVLTRISGV